MRRKTTNIIREIIGVLKNKPLSLRALDIKLNTGSNTIRDCVFLLEDMGIVKIKTSKKQSKIIRHVSLTSKGSRLKLS